MDCIYLTGGRSKKLYNKTADYGSCDAALLLRIPVGGGTPSRLLEYVTPSGARAGELGEVAFKSGTLAGDTLYLCTPTEVMAFRGPGFQKTLYLSLPCFNDVHHVFPTPEGNLLIVSTGLDMVVEITPTGEIWREWGMLGKSPWERFSQEIDYRKVLSTKPHYSHPNFVFQTGEDVWVTRFHQ